MTSWLELIILLIKEMNNCICVFVKPRNVVAILAAFYLLSKGVDRLYEACVASIYFISVALVAVILMYFSTMLEYFTTRHFFFTRITV